ncbi:MAG: hypothetical protein AB7K36_16425 [Chloroflexota bacterium]
MADDGFRLPGSSYEEIVKIIEAYGSLRPDQEVELTDISQRTGMHATSISRNMGFLSSLGLVEGARKRRLTEQGRQLASALHHRIIEDVTAFWRTVVLDNEFMQKVLTAVRIRNGMDPSTLRTHVSYTAGVSKKTGTTGTGAGAVIDILLVSGLLIEQDGKYVVAAELANEASQRQGEHQSALTVAIPSSISQSSFTSSRTQPQQGSTGLNVVLNLQVQIQCSPDDIDDLGPRLRRMLQSLSRPSEDE